MKRMKAGIRATRLLVGCMMLAAVPGVRGEAIHLKNGKTLEGQVLSRDAERIWLETASGRVPVPLARIAVREPGMLEEAVRAYQAGEHGRALKLSEIVAFWEPANEEARGLVERSRHQIDLAERGRELARREREGAALLETLGARLEAIGEPEADPAGAEAALRQLEGELGMAAKDYAGTPLAARFGELREEAGARSLAAHELRLEQEAREQREREEETWRKRAEAMGLRDFLAPTGTMSPGDQTLELGMLRVPGGVTIFEFYREGCASCRELEPRLREMASGDGKVFVRRIHLLDWDAPAARRYDVRSVPSVWVYDSDGKPVAERLDELEEIRAAVARAGGR